MRQFALTNEVAKRKNWHLFKDIRVLLFQNHVPKDFLGEATLTKHSL